MNDTRFEVIDGADIIRAFAATLDDARQAIANLLGNAAPESARAYIFDTLKRKVVK